MHLVQVNSHSNVFSINLMVMEGMQANTNAFKD